MRRMNRQGAIASVLIGALLVCVPWALANQYQVPNLQVMFVPIPPEEMPRPVRQYAQAYRVILSNVGRSNITIESAEITNGYSGEKVYELVRTDVWTSKAFKTLGGSSLKRLKENNQAWQATHKIKSQFDSGPLYTGDYQDTETFVQLGQRPRVTIIYRDNRTGKQHTLSK